MTPGSFLTMSGAIVLVTFGVYDLWLERVVVEVGRRRRARESVDLSPGSHVASRLRKYGLAHPIQHDGGTLEITCTRSESSSDQLDRSEPLNLSEKEDDLSKRLNFTEGEVNLAHADASETSVRLEQSDLLEDLAAFHAWLIEGHAGLPVKHIKEVRLEPGLSAPGRVALP